MQLYVGIISDRWLDKVKSTQNAAACLMQ